MNNLSRLTHPTKLSIALSGETPSQLIAEKCASVGMIRSEYILRNRGFYISTEEGRRAIVDYVSKITDIFFPRPVWYRISDFEAREISTLRGFDAEIFDENPILGDRGIRRAIRFPSSFKDEITNLVPLAEARSNLHIIFPYVGDVHELNYAITSTQRWGWPNKLGSMVEIPSAALQIKSFCQSGISNITVGLNDLTTLTLGADRPSSFSKKNHEVVVTLVKSIIHQTKLSRIPVSIAGNFSPDEVQSLMALQPDFLVVHYSEFSLHDLASIDSLDDIGLVPKVKAITREALERKRQQ